jgi:cysteinyl-tRNA synthetase
MLPSVVYPFALRMGSDAIVRPPATAESYAEIEALVRQREEHRIAKRWDEADAIREQLKTQHKVGRPLPSKSSLV